MTDTEIKALTGLRISLAPTRDDVWRRSEFHVDTLHRQVAEAILETIGDARDSPDASPIGIVVQGQRGAGKTHLLGWVREQVQRQERDEEVGGRLEERHGGQHVVEPAAAPHRHDDAGRNADARVRQNLALVVGLQGRFSEARCLISWTG